MAPCSTVSLSFEWWFPESLNTPRSFHHDVCPCTHKPNNQDKYPLSNKCYIHLPSARDITECCLPETTVPSPHYMCCGHRVNLELSRLCPGPQNAGNKLYIFLVCHIIMQTDSCCFFNIFSESCIQRFKKVLNSSILTKKKGEVFPLERGKY